MTEERPQVQLESASPQDDFTQFDRYRVDLVVYVDVPKKGWSYDGGDVEFDEAAAFNLAYMILTDDEADELWVNKVPDEAVRQLRLTHARPVGEGMSDDVG